MNRKLILLASLFCVCPVINSMQLELPSEQEVLATKNPLTIVLYGLHKSYLKNPVIPTGATFGERLRNHTLLDSDWLSEKGFLEVLQNQHQTGSSSEAVKKAIEDNYAYKKLIQQNMQVTQKIVMANLLQAYADCSVKG